MAWMAAGTSCVERSPRLSAVTTTSSSVSAAGASAARAGACSRACAMSVATVAPTSGRVVLRIATTENTPSVVDARVVTRVDHADDIEPSRRRGFQRMFLFARQEDHVPGLYACLARLGPHA